MPRGNDLDRLTRDMANAPWAMLSAATSAARASLQKSVDSGYSKRQDVNGVAYIPAKDGHLPEMERTGKLRRSYRYPVVDGSNFRLITIEESTPYGQYLRDGTWKMKARQHIPLPDAPLPAAWAADMDTAIKSSVDRVMR